jgi:tetratricopeptide repeat protein 21B
MVEIYLNPDNENIWEGLDGDGAGNANQVNMEAVKICERLLREIKRKPKSLRHEMLECHALIGTKTRPNIELALSRFVETLKKDSECVPALRGMAMALLMLKQTPKARNCLKRIHKMKYDPTFAEDFEVRVFRFAAY